MDTNSNQARRVVIGITAHVDAGKTTLAEAMLLWQAHRPPLADLEKLAASPGIADNWRQKIATRIDWLCKNTGQTPPPVVAFHVKPENP